MKKESVEKQITKDVCDGRNGRKNYFLPVVLFISQFLDCVFLVLLSWRKTRKQRCRTCFLQFPPKIIKPNAFASGLPPMTLPLKVR